jgi:hypothetical protein
VYNFGSLVAELFFDIKIIEHGKGYLELSKTHTSNKVCDGIKTILLKCLKEAHS